MLPSAPTAQFPYRILERAGEGAMGAVFRAEDVELARPVAIKVLRPEYLRGLGGSGAERATRRFLQEARAAAAIRHPAVTVVHRVGTEQGCPFIAMEWLEGSDLGAVFAKHQTISVEQAARLGLQILSALAAAHKEGVVHRDIKPSNLVLVGDRRIKVTDFGVAHVEGSPLVHTEVGVVVGTPQYAAPEQLTGDLVDGRVDLYAVGAVLYEAVTGRPPFLSESLAGLISLVLTAPVIEASSRNPAVSPAFDDFLRKALAKRPAERFQTAGEMARALQGFMTRRPSDAAGAPVPSSPPSSPGTRPIHRVQSHDRQGAVLELIAGWPARNLGTHRIGNLLDRLSTRPLHAEAFSGAVSAGPRWVLVYDGLLVGLIGEEPSDPEERVEAVLHGCPADLPPRIVMRLAALLAPAKERWGSIDASTVRMGELLASLAGEEFDGVVRLERGQESAWMLYNHGARALQIFGPGWSELEADKPWERWIERAGARAHVEDHELRLPASSLRRQLRDQRLEVLREPPVMTGRRVDLAAGGVMLRAKEEELSAFPCTYSCGLFVEADPVAEATRWLLAEAAHQFLSFRRLDRWRAMMEGIEATRMVQLYTALRGAGGQVLPFDVVGYGAEAQPVVVVDRVAVGDASAVLRFQDKVRAAKEDPLGRGLTAGILFTPSFSDAAIEEYFAAQERSRAGRLSAALDLFTHREGFFGSKQGGFHLLLVEESHGRRRPLVPEV